ncbi:hypothetical protein F8M49_30110 [Rhodococcus zopfii]|uniref:Uncharacterized protein n=1 Tax=Rhodococcus zopfii TaxID=43772 RepID=A0ABU3WZ27_9NOCA|nr:hypothetical protein [Rhodococcus zopfii]
MTDANGSAASYFRVLLEEAVGPFVVQLDDGPELVIEAPESDDVADLDTTVSVHDQLDLLVDEDQADIIAEHYARRPISELADLVDDIRQHFGILVPPDAGWAYLVDEIDRYGTGIEKDLFAMPGDERLYDWVRDHLNNPWNRLLRLLPSLPEGGWYFAALGNDDERAEKILEMEQRGELPPPSKRPSLVGWTYDRGATDHHGRLAAPHRARRLGCVPEVQGAKAGSRRNHRRGRRPPAIASRSTRPSSSTTTSRPSSSAAATRGASHLQEVADR